jgi:hypothetical protein
VNYDVFPVQLIAIILPSYLSAHTYLPACISNCLSICLSVFLFCFILHTFVALLAAVVTGNPTRNSTQAPVRCTNTNHCRFMRRCDRTSLPDVHLHSEMPHRTAFSLYSEVYKERAQSCLQRLALVTFCCLVFAPCLREHCCRHFGNTCYSHLQGRSEYGGEYMYRFLF